MALFTLCCSPSREMAPSSLNMALRKEAGKKVEKDGAQLGRGGGSGGIQWLRKKKSGGQAAIHLLLTARGATLV